jgi:outer membrane protein assembly factor BamA
VIKSAVLILTLFLTSVAVGQTARKSAKAAVGSGKLAAVHVGGTQRYKPEEILAASGLQIGATVTEDDFHKAAQRLGECGFFSDVSYSYSATATGIKLDVELVDSHKLVPTHFENFVWFADQELLDRIHEKLPLFKGDVPLGGTLSDQISDILQNLLIPLSASGRADYVRESKEPGGSIDGVAFRATGVNLIISEVDFVGAGPEALPALNAAAENLAGKDYSRSAVQSYTIATITQTQSKVAADTAEQTEVAVQLTVSPGAQYKISDIKWEGNKTFSVEKLQALVHAKPGAIANVPQLKGDLESVHKLYGTRGYMMASIKPDAQLDDASSSVAYKIAVSEGDVFHLGDLDIQGLDAKTVDRLQEAWSLRESDPYDSTYPQRFFEETVKLLSRDVTWTVSIHEGVNEEEKTVDVSLRYGIKPPS